MENRMNSSLRIGLMALFAMMVICVKAEPVDALKAQTSAAQFIRSSVPTRMMASSPALRLAHAEPSVAHAGASDYYVFGVGEDAGFVIVAGDDRAEQVLAWGDGAIDMDNLPCNLAWILDNYKEQMEWLMAHPSAQVETPRQLLSTDGEPFVVASMLSCTWSQSEPYFNQCPEYNGERCVTGCVATAMAQVMYYWRFPEAAPSLSSYRTRSHGFVVPALPPKRIDWDHMIDSYFRDYTPEQGEAVAMLMRYCGQSCSMDYSPNGSGAYVDRQLRGMMSFGYSRDASMLSRPEFSYEEWDALIKDDLAAGRPVLYSGNDPNAGGHAFVLDGYYDGRYHINWGWNNTGNGYFALDAFIVRDYFFGASQQMLHNIHPSTEPVVNTNHDFEVDGIFYKYNEAHTEAIVSSNNTKFNSYSGEVVIPERVVFNGKTLPVTAIGDQAFRNCMELTRVVLPEGITSIGRQAFINCVALQQVSIPTTLTTIGELAFQDCIGMTRVEAPSLDAWLEIEFVDQYANPLNCAHHLFVGGEEVKHLIIDRYVNPYAFINCSGLESLTVNEGVSSMGKAAFSNCTGITSLTLPSTMSSVATQAFSGCSGLTTIMLPEGVETLEYAAFSACSGLKQIMLPMSLRTIGDQAFSKCDKLNKLEVPDAVEVIGASAFSGCSSLQELKLPAALTSLGSSAFHSCSALTDVIIPDQVTEIGEEAFGNCGQLASLTLGRAMIIVGSKAFNNCQLLRSVTCRSTNAPWLGSQECFYLNVYRKATLYVPYESLNHYKTSGYWSWFTQLVGIRIDALDGDVNLDGEITVADVNSIIQAIWRDDLMDVNADVNLDGEVNIADINATIDIILNSSF